MEEIVGLLLALAVSFTLAGGILLVVLWNRLDRASERIVCLEARASRLEQASMRAAVEARHTAPAPPQRPAPEPQFRPASPGPSAPAPPPPLVHTPALQPQTAPVAPPPPPPAPPPPPTLVHTPALQPQTATVAPPPPPPAPPTPVHTPALQPQNATVAPPPPPLVRPSAPVAPPSFTTISVSPWAKPAPDATTDPAPTRSSADWEALLGGNWFAKLGALVVVIGLAFLLQYSFTHMGPGGIVAISVTACAAMLGTGVFFEPRQRYRILARALISGGWAGLYVTVYSMHVVNAARVIDNPYTAAVCLIGVAAGMIVHTLKYRSEIVTGLAYFIAFFTLVITQITSLSLIALIPLAVSMLIIAHHFRWQRMALGGLIATYATVALRPDNGAPLWEAQAIFTVYWLLFEVFDILQADTWLLPLNAAGFLGLSLIKWQRADPEHIWKLLAAVAAAYLVSAVLRARRGRWHGAALLTAGLAAAAIFQRLDHQWVASALVVEAEIFYLAGVKLRSSYVRWLGTGLFILEACRLVTDIVGLPDIGLLPLPVDSFAPVAALDAVVFYANRFLYPADLFYGYAGAAAVALFAGFKAPGQFRGCWWLAPATAGFAFGWWRRLADVRLQGCLLWGLGLIGVEWGLGAVQLSSAAGVSYGLGLAALWSRDDRMRPGVRDALRWLGSLAATAALATLAWRVVDGQYLGIAWIGLAVVLMELGIFGWPKEIRWFALALAAQSALGVAINDTYTLVNHGPWVARLLPAGAAALVYWIAWRSRRFEGWIAPLASWIATGFLAASLWAVLPHDAVGPAWALFGVAILAGGLRWKRDWALWLAGTLAAVSYWWWAVDLLVPGSSPAVPLPAVAGCAVTIACYYTGQLLSPRGHIIRLCASLLATSLTSLLLYDQVSGRLLTIAWGIQGMVLLGAGFSLRDRIPRLSGMAILLACILKLFLHDLSYLEGLPRIFSLIAMGLILIAVSWVYSRFRDRFMGNQ